MWQELIGKKVEAFRGSKSSRSSRAVELEYILFDDGETFIRLDEQCSYTYHDCNSSAKTLNLRKDRKLWKELFDKVGIYEEPNDYP